MAGGEVQLVELVKRFGEFTAVDGINLTVAPGEFFSLLGPSGCGKTTTLRMIAGFERPTEGQVVLDGVNVAATPPHKRNVNTVFQNYALFPHLNVEKNVAFGLKYQQASKQETAERVGRALELVRLEGYHKRRPNQLSGGQQQRVALARALILNPSVLLLDEPLGALDAKLRKALQIELKSIQEEVGITFVYVTHDQEEALTMSDRLAVMSNGRVEQIGPPEEVYEEPSTAYVADFLGVSNLMDATAHGTTSGGCRVRLGEFELVAGKGEPDAIGDVKLSIRPERVELVAAGTTGENMIPGMVERIVYVGSAMQVIVNLAPGEKIQVLVQNEGDDLPFRQGTAVAAHVPPDALRVLPRGEISEEGFAAAAQGALRGRG
ncbi:MAG TPA: ABC transporter ATP-binding protein [Actinomycetota bacterium]|jgi:spermidine/putrescine transport system ATP-binding protein|nr:ABC transporter ATP-binding protein [Actinomycetota bacterium]